MRKLLFTLLLSLVTFSVTAQIKTIERQPSKPAQTNPPKQTTPKQTTPKQTTPKQTPPKQTTPKQNPPKQTQKQNSEPAGTSFCPDGNHPHMIDLGLPSGTKWSCCNVGSSKPEASGDYISWGETKTKSTYDWKSYAYCGGTQETCRDIGKDISGTQYDVAHVKWGGKWQMPTEAQRKELEDKCTYTWTSINGVKGGKFTGPNGKSIFLPAAGVRWNGGLDDAGSYGYYWSSTQALSNSNACIFYFGSGGAVWYPGGRFIGYTVRPVLRN